MATETPRRVIPIVARAPFLSALLAALATAAPALGQTPSPEDIASARVLGTQGVRLADAGDCLSAVTQLEAAEKLYHAPTTLERLGECQVELGHVVAGTESLNRVAHEVLPTAAPAPFVAAHERAARILQAALPRIARLRIHITGAPIDAVTVTVDGAGVPAALFDADRPTDPGQHVVKATANGYKPVVTPVGLASGSSSEVSLALEPEQASAATTRERAPSTAAATGAEDSPPVPAGGPNRVPAFVALGVGAAGIAVGSVFGMMALGSKSTLDNACPGKVCPSTLSQSDVDALSTRATLSNVGFGVGIVGLAVGAVLLVTAGGGQATSGSAQKAQGRFEPWVGAGAAGVGGTFE